MGAAALVAGAVLAVLASLQPLYERTLTIGGDGAGFRMTLWGIEWFPEALMDDDSNSILFGVPVVVAAVLLVVVAVLVLAAPRLSPWLAAPTRTGAIAAATLLIGSVWTLGQQVLAAMSMEDTPDSETAVGTGMWTLVLACVVSLAGGLLVQKNWPDRRSVAGPEPEGVVVYRLPDADDTDTPPFGVPIHEDRRGGDA